MGGPGFAGQVDFSARHNQKNILFEKNYINVITPYKNLFAKTDIAGKTIRDAQGKHIYEHDTDFTEYNNAYHDIRTPLNAIVGMTNMAISSIDDQKQALEDMKIVTAASKHLLSLVNDVLDLSKIESGQILLAQNRFSLAELIVEVERISWPLLNVKNQEFRVSADHAAGQCNSQ